jgi:hypothetical protein
MSLNQATGGMSFFDMGLMKFDRRRKKKTIFIGEPKFQFVKPTYLFDKQSFIKEENRKLDVWYRNNKRDNTQPWWLK